MAEEGWFEDIDPDDASAAAEAIREGRSDGPADWPARAVASGSVDDREEYYRRLREATIEAARRAVDERERAPDQQLVHAVRALDDCARTANELSERLSEWAGSYYDETESGIEYARTVADRDPGTQTEERIVALAERVVGLATERDSLEEHVEDAVRTIAPNLSELAGPLLAARLIALAGGLETLAKKPSGTLQVLGAEDALFAHLQGRAPSPKHGIIYTHEYVSGTRPEERGSAARALAGKLSIAARVDHYSGERKPELAAELDRRIERIRSRGEG